jgi:hypothetical protein
LDSKEFFGLKNLLNAFHCKKGLILSPDTMKRYEHLSD